MTLTMLPSKRIHLLSFMFTIVAYTRTFSSLHAAAEPVASTGSNNNIPLPDALPERRPRIHGGWDSQEDRYSYAQVNLKWRKKGHQCGGSLIAPDMVLTAGHCHGSFDKIEIGKYRKNDVTDFSEEFVSELEIVHPDYEESTTRFDIMVVKLKGRSSMASPVRINRDAAVPVNDMMLTVIGMGYNGDWELPDVFQEAPVRYQVNDECDDIVDEHGISLDGDLYPDMLCAGFGGRDSCYGDSGSPLVLKGDSEQEDVQIGLVSWGYECAGTLPGIYSRLSYLPTYNFIEQHVCIFSEEPPDYMDCEQWSLSPTVTPSMNPTNSPTLPPSAKPTAVPTANPTRTMTPTKLSAEPTTGRLKDALAENIFLHDLDMTFKNAELENSTQSMTSGSSSAFCAFTSSRVDAVVAALFGTLWACTLF